ncbi:hypothetical protein GCM10011289_35480 [Paludibacterium paludis]|uniref:Uncharacterized protein n=1 Tax=Paludibacterium paludis TaxID=1225769 RepID=A0A918P724_9NEIS|nr:hypothetical protein GCM10011289_35480 [Paludibacterium paludis]
MSVAFRQCTNRIKNGGQKHEHRSKDTDDLRYIAQVNAKRGQNPTQTHDKEHERKNNDWHE